MDKQQAGFKFGRHRLQVTGLVGEVNHVGRTYKLVHVRTQDGIPYLSLRLYNEKRHFIKQLLFEPALSKALAELLLEA